MAPNCTGGGEHDDDRWGVPEDSKRGLRHGAVQGVIVIDDGEKLVPPLAFTCVDAPAGSPGYLEVDPDTHQGFRCLAAARDDPPVLEAGSGEILRVLTSDVPQGVVVAGVPPGLQIADGAAAPQLTVIARAVRADKAGHRWDVRLPGTIDYPWLLIELLSATPAVGPVAGYEVALRPKR